MCSLKEEICRFLVSYPFSARTGLKRASKAYVCASGCQPRLQACIFQIEIVGTDGFCDGYLLPYVQTKMCFLYETRRLQAHAAVVGSIAEVKLALKGLQESESYSTASSSPVAFRINLQENRLPTGVVLCEDCQDEGVIEGGDKLLHLLQSLDVRNILLSFLVEVKMECTILRQVQDITRVF